MTTTKIGFLALSAALAMAGCEDAAKEAPKPALPDNYKITLEGLFPESLDFDEKNHRFVITSYYKGAVYTLAADGQQPIQEFANSDRLITLAGVYADEARDRYIVASGNSGICEKSPMIETGMGSIGYVEIYDANTAALIKSVDLKPLVPEGFIFPNDFAVDDMGNIYVTDSLSPVIYMIDPQYNATIFISNPEQFSIVPGKGVGLNGIVYKDGYLLVSKTVHDEAGMSKIFKIDVAQKSVMPVGGLDALSAIDGLRFAADGKLIAVESGVGNGVVHVLNSSDQWATASDVKQVPIGKDPFPTAATLAEGNIYAITSYFGKMISGDKAYAEYNIVKVATE